MRHRAFNLTRASDSRPMILAHHLILSLYGHWAPNDLRGSGSDDLRDEKFEPLGPIHFGRKPDREQPSREELRAFHARFNALLKHPPFWIDERIRAVMAEGFAATIRDRGYTCWACAICSNHAHLVVRVHRDDALAMWHALAEVSRLRLRDAGIAEIGPDHPVWADRPYKVFLRSVDDIEGRVTYVESNPEQEGLPQQRWPFVIPYDGWPLHKQRAKTQA